MHAVRRIHDLPGDSVFVHPAQYRISRQDAKIAKVESGDAVPLCCLYGRWLERTLPGFADG